MSKWLLQHPVGATAKGTFVPLPHLLQWVYSSLHWPLQVPFPPGLLGPILEGGQFHPPCALPTPPKSTLPTDGLPWLQQWHLNPREVLRPVLVLLTL